MDDELPQLNGDDSARRPIWVKLFDFKTFFSLSMLIASLGTYLVVQRGVGGVPLMVTMLVLAVATFGFGIGHLFDGKGYPLGCAICLSILACIALFCIFVFVLNQ
ncbi:MAG TPA: hypothetical protein VJ783_31940 [Pirellulales bacterium]|nr:hypothetical protein [Pirellulales bacterium]